MERSRQISPSTRKPKSPYRVDIKGIEANEILTITITHKEIPSFKETYIFDGKSLFEVWDAVTVEKIDGCEPLERLENYIGENK